MRKKVTTPFALPIPGFGESPLTSEDFERACAREGIAVRRERIPDETARGYYSPGGGSPFIVIDARLRGRRKLLAEFHELAHHFLHGWRHDFRSELAWERLGGKRHYTPRQEWAEMQADAAALLAVAPGLSLPAVVRFLLPELSMTQTRGKEGTR